MTGGTAFQAVHMLRSQTLRWAALHNAFSVEYP